MTPTRTTAHGAGERDPTEHEPHRTNDTDRTTTAIMEATQQLSRGSLRKAVKVLESHGIALPTDEVKEQLKALHPRASEQFQAESKFDLPKLVVTNSEIRNALKELPRDSAAGISGLTNVHLNKMAGLQEGEMI